MLAKAPMDSPPWRERRYSRRIALCSGFPNTENEPEPGPCGSGQSAFKYCSSSVGCSSPETGGATMAPFRDITWEGRSHCDLVHVRGTAPELEAADRGLLMMSSQLSPRLYFRLRVGIGFSNIPRAGLFLSGVILIRRLRSIGRLAEVYIVVHTPTGLI